MNRAAPGSPLGIHTEVSCGNFKGWQTAGSPDLLNQFLGLGCYALVCTHDKDAKRIDALLRPAPCHPHIF
eukprot:1269911-Amphidinium_carterae.2